jgi:hypothetical protein
MDDNIDDVLTSSIINLGSEDGTYTRSIADDYISKVLQSIADNSDGEVEIPRNESNPRIITTPDDYESVEDNQLESKINAVYDKICLLDRGLVNLGDNLSCSVELLTAQISTLAKDQSDLRADLRDIKKLLLGKTE